MLKLFFIPEANGDCQTREWKLQVLLLGLMQVVSNLILLVPFFVAAGGAAGDDPEQHHQEKHASWLLVTLLAWLLPTLVIVGGLLDGLFVLHLVEGKATKGTS